MSVVRFETIDAFDEFLLIEKAQFLERYDKKIEVTKSRKDFEFLQILGIGTFGQVLLVRLQNHPKKKYYAMKLIKKDFIVQYKQVDHILSEKRVLQSLNFIFTVSMKYFFMDNSYLYFVLPFIAGGELFHYLQGVRYLPEDQARFYAAQVLLALQYLHNFQLLYRDLKPENILIDDKGYLKLTDFGFCKLVSGRTYTMCGTPDYMAPEILLNKGYNKSVDYWALGILIFEMCAGFPPFIAIDLLGLYAKITSAKFKNPNHFSKDLKDLTKRLIHCDLSKRLGNTKGGVEGIKQHNWFKTIHWLSLLNYEVEAPYIPKIKGSHDTENFDYYVFVDSEFEVADVDNTEYYFESF